MAIHTNLSELKKRALLAKQRLRMGYWQAMQEDRAKKLNEFSGDFDSRAIVQQLQREQINRDDNLAIGLRQAVSDEILYQKVCELLESDEVITNPIGELVDKELYEKLDEGNRQKYILDLSKKFRELKARYANEQAIARYSYK